MYQILQQITRHKFLNKKVKNEKMKMGRRRGDKIKQNICLREGSNFCIYFFTGVYHLAQGGWLEDLRNSRGVFFVYQSYHFLFGCI